MTKCTQGPESQLVLHFRKQFFFVTKHIKNGLNGKNPVFQENYVRFILLSFSDQLKPKVGFLYAKAFCLETERCIGELGSLDGKQTNQ